MVDLVLIPLDVVTTPALVCLDAHQQIAPECPVLPVARIVMVMMTRPWRMTKMKMEKTSAQLTFLILKVTATTTTRCKSLSLRQAVMGIEAIQEMVLHQAMARLQLELGQTIGRQILLAIYPSTLVRMDVRALHPVQLMVASKVVLQDLKMAHLLTMRLLLHQDSRMLATLFNLPWEFVPQGARHLCLQGILTVSNEVEFFAGFWNKSCSNLETMALEIVVGDRPDVSQLWYIYRHCYLSETMEKNSQSQIR
jgi:hypothetical protein